MVLISFAVIFLLGIFVYDDFGISVDEHVERDSSYLLYSKLITNTDIEAPYFDKEEANEYWNRYYMAIQLPTVVLEQAIGKDWSIQQVYFMRHLYTFLLYFTSVIVFYFYYNHLIYFQLSR